MRRPDPPQRTVLIVSPGAELYGSDRMVVATAAALIGSGRRVVVALGADGPLVSMIERTGAAVVVCPTPVLRKRYLSPVGLVQLAGQAVRQGAPAWKLLRSVRPQTMIVNTLTAPLWFLLGRAARTRVVCHIHEAEASVHPLVRKALYAPLALADRCLINSRFSLGVVRREAPRAARRTRIVYNEVAGPPHVVPPREAVEGPVRLLFVGRLSERKGPHVAVDALGRLREAGVTASLTLAGAVFPGNEAYEERLRARVDELGLSERVTFLGFVDDVWAQAAQADIWLVPSTVDEPFGNVAVEASLAARPQVVSDIAGLKEASAHASAVVLVPPQDAGALADAIARIVAEWPGYRAKALADVAVVADHFSAERYASGIVAAVE